MNDLCLRCPPSVSLNPSLYFSTVMYPCRVGCAMLLTSVFCSRCLGACGPDSMLSVLKVTFIRGGSAGLNRVLPAGVGGFFPRGRRRSGGEVAPPACGGLLVRPGRPRLRWGRCRRWVLNRSRRRASHFSLGSDCWILENCLCCKLIWSLDSRRSEVAQLSVK